MDARLLLPCATLGKRITKTKIKDALKVMRYKGKSLCLRDYGKQKFPLGTQNDSAIQIVSIKLIMKNFPRQK